MPYVHPNLHHFVTNNHRNKRPTRFWGRRGQVPWMTFAKPMSVSFTRPLSVSSRFSGFKSRKTILLVSSCREIELRYVVRKDATLISIYLYIYNIVYIYMIYYSYRLYRIYIYTYIIHIYIYIYKTYIKKKIYMWGLVRNAQWHRQLHCKSRVFIHITICNQTNMIIIINDDSTFSPTITKHKTI